MFKQLYERYKNLVFLKRALIVFLVSGSYFAFDLFTKIEALDIEKKEIEDKLFSEKNNLNKVLLEIKRLPGIKEDLVQAEKNFTISKKRLPDDFYVERLLETFSSLAKKDGLTLDLFDPGIPMKEEESYTYISLPISVVLTGEFYHIVKFMENVLNQDQFLEIRNYKLDLVLGSSERKEAGNISESEKQHADRKNSKIKLEASIFAFRSLSEKEFNSVNAQDVKTNKKKNKIRE